MSEQQNLLDKLIHYYNDSPAGNIGKLLNLWAEDAQTFLDAWQGVQDSHLLQNATGISLDYLGAALGIGRTDDQTDEEYRARLYLEIEILTSSGLLEEIRSILSQWFNIPTGDIFIYLNDSPSQGLTDLDYFVEISIHTKHFPSESVSGFRFSATDDTPVYDSPYGFGGGVMAWEVTPSEVLSDMREVIERILGCGVQYEIASHGGFKFSDDSTTPAYDSSRGFGAGTWRGVFRPL